MHFDEQLRSMKEIYLDIERQLKELSYVIPLNNQLDTYSPRFYSILQYTCAQVHSMLKMISKELDIKIKSDKFPEYYEALNKDGMLNKQQIFVIERKQMINPFEQGKKPDWWIGYNSTKHGLPEGVKDGTLGNVINALAATFILYYIADRRNRLGKDHRIIEGKRWSRIKFADAMLDNKELMRMSRSSEFFSKFVAF